MACKKLFYRLPIMPPSTIHIQPNGVSIQPAINVLQNFKKSVPIATLCPNHADTSQQRSHPTRYVQSLIMLAGRHNSYPRANTCPSSSQPRMQGKPTFILKHDSLMFTQPFQFFLMLGKTASRPQFLPEYKSSLHASVGTQADASGSAPVELSSLSQIASVDDLPWWVHPIGHDLNHIFPETVLNASLTALRSLVLRMPDVPAWVSPLKIQSRSHLPLVHIGLRSYGLNPILQKSILAADPQSLITMLLFLDRSLRHGLLWLRLLILSSLLQVERWLMFSCIKYNILYAHNVTLFIAFVLIGS